MMLRRAGLVVFVFVLLGVSGQIALGKDQGSDSFRQLAGDSPACSDSGAHSNCKESGAVETKWTLERYKLDSYVDTGLGNFGGYISAFFQTIINFVWMIFLYVMRGVLLSFQWAFFKLDLVNAGLPEVRKTLRVLQDDVFDRAWLVALLVVLGVWALFKGLVQRRMSETVGGIAASALILIASLLIITSPKTTIGALSEGANDLSLYVLSAVTRGTTENSKKAVVSSSQAVWETIVESPWCALQFGSVKFCRRRTTDGKHTHGSRFLRYSTLHSRDNGKKYREREYKALNNPSKFDDLKKKYPKQFEGYRVSESGQKYVDMMQEGHTAQRFALLAIIVFMLIGALLLLGWLIIRVIFMGLLTLLLLVLLPVILFASAWPGKAHGLWKNYALALVGAAIGKALYSIGLALVLAIAAVIQGMESSYPWLVIASLNSAFYWGIFLSRKRIGALLSGGGSISATSYMKELTGMGRSSRDTGEKIAAPAVYGAKRAYNRSSESRASNQQAKEEVVKTKADDSLKDSARDKLDKRYEANKEEVEDENENRKKIASVGGELKSNKNLKEDDRDKLVHQQRKMKEKAMPEHVYEGKKAHVRNVETRKAQGLPAHSDRDVEQVISKMASEDSEALGMVKDSKHLRADLAKRHELLVKAGEVQPVSKRDISMRRNVKASGAGKKELRRLKKRTKLTNKELRREKLQTELLRAKAKRKAKRRV